MKKAFIRVGLVLIGLLLAEVSWRTIQFVGEQPGDEAASRDSIEGVLREMGISASSEPGEAKADLSQRKFLHPFYGFETIEGHEAITWQAEFARKLRSDPGAADPLPLTILVLGGSQARIFADPVANGGVEALVSTLEAGLPDLGRRIVVLGHGREAFQQPQQVTLLAYLYSLGLRPDVVINLDGFNEVGIGMFNHAAGQNPLFPAQPMWSEFLARQSSYLDNAPVWERAFVQRDKVRRAAELSHSFPFEASAILKTCLELYVRRCRTHWREEMSKLGATETADTTPGVSRGIPYEGGEETALDMIVESWIDSSISLDAICRARGALYLHVLQPTLHDEGSKPLTELEREEGAADPAIERGAREGYPLLRAASPRLGEAGVAFLDASGLFREVEERVYYDLCHFNRPGTEWLGEAIGRAILERAESFDW